MLIMKTSTVIKCTGNCKKCGSFCYFLTSKYISCTINLIFFHRVESSLTYLFLRSHKVIMKTNLGVAKNRDFSHFLSCV